MRLPDGDLSIIKRIGTHQYLGGALFTVAIGAMLFDVAFAGGFVVMKEVGHFVVNMYLA